jgi:ADP-ribosyl-[dinitrogen reductase] hydrolase
MERSRLETLLGVATDAAVRAGRQIRSEFHRAGGPRGEGSKAPIDVRVERELRETLLAASGAGVGFLGEELGYAGPEGASALWVVDPHDGTSAFLRGFRGSSVSIALVEGGVAVLGVVFAPCAPTTTEISSRGARDRRSRATARWCGASRCRRSSPATCWWR